ncbi:hypothetical protein HYALB_00005731 [Hymenoscyphus albidus]|uniref:Uncharacterized protein n=1 Tax=Hymenoscyphus albidus TaxID=595503 RepID=A0A9N9LJI5_9HELO|nr:hypothetical protein HYALB_00005731 [Hymenoscyphus albidus]
MYSKLTTAALLVGAFRFTSAESCTYGKYSCQGLSPARCVYTSGVAGTDGKYETGWVNLDTCKEGCSVIGGVAQCGAASDSAATTLVKVPTQVAGTTVVAASPTKGAVFAQTGVASKPTTLSKVVKTSTTAPVNVPTSPATPSNSKSILSSASGKPIDATFYYDVHGGGTCGAVNGISAYAEVGGYTYCEPSDASQAKTLAQRGTNNIVAMPQNLITGNASKYCGKKVVVTWEGKKRTDLELFIWDSCASCTGDEGLDFSSTIFAQLAGEKNCAQGRIENKMTWEIVDETVLQWKQ